MGISRTSFKKGERKLGKDTSRFSHGMCKTRIYHTWSKMKQRCEYTKDIAYARYGGKGIKVCKEWQTFEGFYKDMGSTYKDDLTIERIDNSKGYQKNNCKWIPRFEQGRNRSTVKKYQYRGKPYYLSELAGMAGIKHRTMYARLYVYKWPVLKAVETPYGYQTKN